MTMVDTVPDADADAAAAAAAAAAGAAAGDLARRLEQVERELDLLVYSVGHDLRAPLRHVRGFAKLLQEDYSEDLDDDGQQFVAFISEAAERMDGMLDGLLELARIGRAELDARTVSLSDVVAAALERGALPARASDSRIEVAPDLPEVRGDADALLLAVTELLSNAVRYVPDDVTPEVRIEAEASGDVVRLSVSDNGVGVESKHHERIFRVFERADAPADRPGAGMGLAFARRIIHGMGGQIGVDTGANGGCCFWVELPRP